jgi:UDP-glucose 4-epimerase
MKNKIIVTDGAGFIGSHLIDRLLLRSDEVIVLDNLSSGKMEILKEHIEKTVRDATRSLLNNG